MPIRPSAFRHLIVIPKLILAVWPMQARNGAPCRWRQAIDFSELAGRAPAQGEEGDAGGIEPVEPLIGGELGVEDEVLRLLAVLTPPEFDEPEDFLGLLSFTDIGVGIAEHLGIGILRQEGEDAGLTANSRRA
jgi:hypothetical protein